MDSNKIEKIKELVNKAPILSALEKAEWLALLSVMSDKQLSELEKILVTSEAVVVAKPADKIVELKKDNKPIARPIEPLKPAPVPKIPALSHIMNLPKNVGTPAGALPKSVSQVVTPQSLVKNILDGKLNKPAPTGAAKFAAKLKEIIGEKELTAGVENPSVNVAQVVKEKSPVIAELKPIVTKPLPPTPQKPKVADLQKIAPVPAPAPSPTKLNLNVGTLIIKTPPTTVSPSNSKPAPGPDSSARQTVSLPLKPVKPPLGSAFTPGLNFPNASAVHSEAAIAEIKLRLEQKPAREVEINPIEVKPKIEPLEPVVGLEKLENLSQFSLAVLQNYNLTSLTAKIKTLITQFGYFDVIFNLEKSPTYQKYIATGLKLLSDQSDFEQFESKSKPGEYLKREDFEKFADLLSKIQTS